MNCAGYFNRLIKTHGWDTVSSKSKKPEPSPDPSPEPSPDPSPDPSSDPSSNQSPDPSPDPSPAPSPAPSLFQDCMKSSKPIAPIPADYIEQIFKDVSPPENTAAHKALESTRGFSY
jgi:hypothetical protein